MLMRPCQEDETGWTSGSEVGQVAAVGAETAVSPEEVWSWAHLDLQELLKWGWG